MIKITLEEVMNSQLALNKLISLSEEGKIPFKLGYKVTRIIKKVEPEIKEFQEQQLQLLKKYGTEILEEQRDERGTVVLEEVDGTMVPKKTFNGNYNLGDNVEKFNDEYKQLLSTEVEIVNAQPIKLEELETVNLTIREVSSLEPFVEAQ